MRRILGSIPTSGTQNINKLIASAFIPRKNVRYPQLPNNLLCTKPHSLISYRSGSSISRIDKA